MHELGIEDGHIPDQSMTASSRLDNNHGAGRGRLNQGPTGSQGTAWCAGETDNNQYLQIDLSEYNHYNVIPSRSQPGTLGILRYRMRNYMENAGFILQTFQ